MPLLHIVDTKRIRHVPHCSSLGRVESSRIHQTFFHGQLSKHNVILRHKASHPLVVVNVRLVAVDKNLARRLAVERSSTQGIQERRLACVQVQKV